MAEITVYPASYDSVNYAYASVNSSYPLSNPVGKGSSNTTYAQWNIKTGSTAESYVFYIFDLSEIPAAATIDNVSCTAKAYISSTNSSRINTRQIQMYYGTSTAKGSASTVSNSTSALTLTCGDWTREELNDCRVRIYTKRGTSYTSTTYYNRFYGATLTVTYTYNAVTYTVTATASSGGSIEPSGSITVSEGDNIQFKMIPDDGYSFDSLTVDGNKVDAPLTTENGVENGIGLFHLNGDLADELQICTITNSGATSNTSVVKFGSGSLYFDQSSYLQIDLASNTPATIELWFYPQGDNTSGWYPTLISSPAYGSSGGTYMHIDDGSYSTYPVCRANSSTANTNNGSYGTTVITRNAWHHFALCISGSSHYYFIDGVLQATVSQSSPNDYTTWYLGGLWGGSAMTSGCYYLGYIDEIMISSTCKWTSSFTVPTNAYSATQTSYYSYTLENVTGDKVLYATFIQNDKTEYLYLKRGTSWATVQKAYRKINGIWVEQTELGSLFDVTANYIKG